jgi:glutamate-1-semialdehyde 2,1-aminomutase
VNAESRVNLDELLADAQGRYADARPVSASWADRAQHVLPGGNTRSVLHFDPFPFRVERAEGRYLYDVDRHRYVDLLGNYTAGFLGHSPPAVKDAVHTVIDAGWSFGSTHPNEVLLAELITGRFPSIDTVRFTNSGTEANLMALALATFHTGRRKIVAFHDGYHGGVLTFGHGSEVVNVPHDFVMAAYNDLESVDSVFAEHGATLAAVLIEPVQGSAGCFPADPSFLRHLRDLCDRHGTVLIFDEVMTSRLSPGGAQQLLGISPDLTTLGKYLAGGFTFGAFGGRRDLMTHFDATAGGALGHAGTFNNNVVSMAAGVAALTHVLTPDVLADTNARGDRLRRRLTDVFGAHGLPMCVTGAGSLLNIHATPGPVRSAADLARADDRLKALLFFTALDSGYYFARRGFIALSIEVTDDDIDGFVGVVDEWGERATLAYG